MLTFTYLRRALSAETLKLKRTLAVWMVLIAPSVVVALNFVMLLDRGENFMSQADTAWQALAQNILLFWALMMLPLFVTLETALLGGVDHNSQQWKHLYALPIPRWAIYAAKSIIALALIGASALVLWGETIAAGSVALCAVAAASGQPLRARASSSSAGVAIGWRVPAVTCSTSIPVLSRSSATTRG